MAGRRPRSSRPASCGATRPARSTSRWTCGSSEPHALLVLPVAGPLPVRLLRGRGEVLEDDLREPLADWELEDLGSVRVEPAQGQRAAEARIHLPEAGEEALPGPRRPDPELGGDVGPEVHDLCGGDREPGVRREPRGPGAHRLLLPSEHDALRARDKV